MRSFPRLRAFGSTLLFVISLLLSVSFTAQGAVFIVTRLDDPAPGNCAVGDCSLREAVLAANASGDASNTIELQAETYTLTIAGEDATGQMGDLDVLNNNLTVNGNGGVIDAFAIMDRIFHVPNVSLNLTLNDLTLTGGSSIGGGAIFMDGLSTSDTLTINRCLIENNEGGLGGGGILGNQALLAINDSTISNNGDTPAGGATFVGGGIAAVQSGLFITNSTISTNTAASDGGGVWAQDSLVGYFNATITNNTSMDQGGGVYQIGSGFSAMIFINSILAGNFATNGSEDCNRDPGDSVGSSGFNIFGDINNCMGAGGITLMMQDQDNVADPGLLPLSNYGGPTPTHLLDPNSPAIDNGDPTGCKGVSGVPINSDQRGQTRPAGAECDSGAVELGISDLSLTKDSNQTTDVPGGTTVTYTVTVTNNGPDHNFNVTVTDDLPDGASFQSASATAGTCAEAGGIVSCDLDQVDNGATVTITITVVLNNNGTNTNTASVTGTEEDPDPNNNSDSFDINVIAGGDGCSLNRGRENPANGWAYLILAATLGMTLRWRRRISLN